MKNFIRILQSKVLAGLLLLLLYSCADKKWDEYYVKPEYLSEGSIMHILAGNSEYSEFSELLRITGYDSLLTRNEKITVFALKNGSISGINTSDLVALKKIIGMHILPSVVFEDKMGNNRYLSLSGKPLRFAVTTEGGTVNKINITSFDKRVINGVIHEVESVILPLPSILEFVKTDPDFSFFKTYIDSSYTAVVDVVKNKITGYDTLGKPVYKEPIIYSQSSNYMPLVRIDSEMVLSTVFVPTLSALNNSYAKMLAARGGNLNLVVPRLNKIHGDTIVGYYFVPKNTAYKGDSAVMMDYLFKYAAVRGEMTGFASGINNLTNVSGGKLVIDQSKIVTDSTKYASNGYIYTLNDITLPDSAYRRSFILQTTPRITPNKAIPAVTIPNPQIVYRGGYTNPSDVSVANAYAGRYTLFDFWNIGTELDIIMPYVTSGYYRINLKIQSVATSYSGGGIFDAFYGTTKLVRFPAFADLGTGNYPITVTLGYINVPATGPVTITFRNIERNRNWSQNYLPLSAVEFVPVNAP